MAKSRVLLLAGCSIAAALGSSAFAQDDDAWHFKVYGGPAYVAPLNDDDVSFQSVTDSLQAEDHVGWNLGFEGRFNKFFGLELDYVNAHQDVTFGGSTIGDTTFSPLTLSANFHLVSTKVVDFYLGPAFTYVNWGEIELDANGSDIVGSGANLGLDSETGWGIGTGLDIGLGKHFAIGAGLKWLNVDMTLDNGQTTSVEPLVARLTAAFRF